MLSFVHTNGFIGKLIKHIVSLESKYLTRNIFKNITFLQIGELNQNYNPPKLCSTSDQVIMLKLHSFP